MKRYMEHPYHANLLDEFLSPESPANVIAHSMAVEWDAAREFSVGQGLAATPPGCAVHADTPAVGGPLTLVEHLEIAPESISLYLRKLQEVYLPLVEPHGLTLQMFLHSLDRPEHCVALWSIPHWKAVAALRASLIIGGGLDVWHDSIEGVRTGGVRRHLVAVGGTEPAAGIRPGVTLLLDETILPAHGFEQALTEIGERVARVNRPGVRLVRWLRSPDQSGESNSKMIWELEVERPWDEVEGILSAIHGSGSSTSARLLNVVCPTQ
jgi:hypothetical protein